MKTDESEVLKSQLQHDLASKNREVGCLDDYLKLADSKLKESEKAQLELKSQTEETLSRLAAAEKVTLHLREKQAELAAEVLEVKRRKGEGKMEEAARANLAEEQAPPPPPLYPPRIPPGS